MNVLSVAILLACAVPLGYLLLLALGSLKRPFRAHAGPGPSSRFVVAIPAHNESNVIGATVERMHCVDYPAGLYTIHVIADHCSDDTARLARRAGAIVHERNEGCRTDKGAALSWFLRRLPAGCCDAIVLFDSDTCVDPGFLRAMDARLRQGEQVIQGQHLIGNSGGGWFPALAWAMFLVDNRFQNLGRTNLGWSAKNMGDSICFRADVLREMGGGEGLAEDYQLRQRLLLAGVTIAYEPAAIGRGEAPRTWRQARPQRARWVRGAREASRLFARRLLAAGIRQRDGALLDGALQALLPSYSVLTAVCTTALAIHALVNRLVRPVFAPGVIAGWTASVAVLFLYPFVGLLLERAPLRAFVALLSGPLFVVWRTWLALAARIGAGHTGWIRTSHGSRIGEAG